MQTCSLLYCGNDELVFEGPCPSKKLYPDRLYFQNSNALREILSAFTLMLE